MSDTSVEKYNGFVKKERVHQNRGISREELRSRIQQVVAATNIVELIDPLIDGGLQKKGTGYVGLCPFHSDTNPSFSVSEEKAVYRCWSCDAGQNGSSGGNAVTFVMRYFDKSFMQACQMLADRLNVKLLDDEPKEKGLDRQSFFTNPDLIKALNERRIMQAKQREEKTYLSTEQEQINALAKAHTLFVSVYKKTPLASDYITHQRQISPATVGRFNLGYAPPEFQLLREGFEDYSPNNHALVESGLVKISAKDPERVYDTFRNRLLFPVRNDAGQTVGFGGRLIEDEVFKDADGKDVKAPKYLNSPESAVFKKSELLFGWHENQEQISNLGQVIVVEGYMDVVGLYDQGVGHAVACMGVALTEKHVEKISEKAQDIVVCFDGDNAGRLAATRSLNGLLPMLHLGVTPRFLLLKGGLDPDEFVKQYGKEAFADQVKQAHSLDAFIDLVLQDIAKQNESETDEVVRDKQLSQLQHWMRLAQPSPDVTASLKERCDALKPVEDAPVAPPSPSASHNDHQSSSRLVPVPVVALAPPTLRGGFSSPSRPAPPAPTRTQPLRSSPLVRNQGSSLASKRGISPEERIIDTIALAPRAAYQQIRQLKEYGQNLGKSELQALYEQWTDWYSQEARHALALFNEGAVAEEDDRAIAFLGGLHRVFEVSAKRGLIPTLSSTEQDTGTSRPNP